MNISYLNAPNIQICLSIHDISEYYIYQCISYLNIIHIGVYHI